MPDMQEFNEWHADVAKSSACDLIFQQALGLPEEVASNSLLNWAGIAEMAAALRLAPGQTLVDLACGRGGYGREMARRTGARLRMRCLRRHCTWPKCSPRSFPATRRPGDSRP